MPAKTHVSLPVVLLGLAVAASAQDPRATTSSAEPRIHRLADLRMRDPCILPDRASRTYYLVGSGGPYVRAYTSKDLLTWEGPREIYRVPDGLWGDIPITGIWAPEMHAYQGKYYLFLTFNTRHELPEQWRNWPPRVTRGSQVLVSAAPTGPFRPFENHSTLPVDMMTLDATLWVEDGVPYMVFCHEWVQITNGTVEFIRLKDDLSGTVGEPVLLFHGSEAAWSKTGQRYGHNITDGPYVYKSTSGKLFMIWSSNGLTGYTTGVAVSASGKLAGPWTQQAEPVYNADGGHGMLFTTFDGKLMMVLHAPNGSGSRPRVFSMEDTGDTLRISGELTGEKR